MSYAAEAEDGARSITCPRCGMTSWNPNDVRERYCGNCHAYHDDDMLEDGARWRCPWVLPVGPEEREAVRAICVWPEPHGDDVEHVAVVDDAPVLFGADVGEKRSART